MRIPAPNPNLLANESIPTLDRSWREVLRVGRLLGKDWEWGKSEDLKRAHFSLKLDFPRRDFLWVPTRLIIFQISIWLDDERCLSQ
jgi:hypothetical protein